MTDPALDNADPGGVIEATVRSELENTPFAVSALTSLTGGNANFLYRATLEKPLPDGASEVAVKHGEPFGKFNRDFALTTTRCHVEEAALRYVSKLAPVVSPSFVVQPPKWYHFNPKTNTQVQEFLPNAVNLKYYAIKHYAAPTPELLKPQCLQLGRALGTWLRSYHTWSQQPEHRELRDIAGNKQLQGLRMMINYESLLGVVKKRPELLGDVGEVTQQIHDMAVAELEDQSKLEVTYGDFWTGNVLLPDVPMVEGSQTPIRVVDWEMTQLGIRPVDVGQMMAELWQLKLFKDIDAGEWMLKGLAEGYGGMDDKAAFRAILHISVHLIGIGSTTPGWGTAEQIEKVILVGKEVMLGAWKQERAWFKGHVLECLFSS